LNKVKGRATELEDVLLKYGIHPEYYDIDGTTEFHALCEVELENMVKIIDVNFIV
jgi:NTP pyrophosphatase (non-canonical NTP hydrolase)